MCICVCLSLLLSGRIVYLCATEDFYQCLCVPASCYISTVLCLPWYYPSGHYHYVPSSGLTAPHIICSVKEQQGQEEGGIRFYTTCHRGFYSHFPHSQTIRLVNHFLLISLFLGFSSSFFMILLLLAFFPSLCFFSDPYSFLFACLLICSLFVFTWYISTSPHATHPSLL